MCNARPSGIREAAVLNMVDSEEMVEVEVKGWTATTRESADRPV